MMLLSRTEFKEHVFNRDNNKCVFCGEPAIDAHHIMDRKLFQGKVEQGGYFLSNGASICAEHHMLCENTSISVEEVRKACGIKEVVLPEHLTVDETYDKWGNIILSNGLRLRGELFYDDGFQNILKKYNLEHFFTEYVKYPRTFHAPWSPGCTSDDKKHPNMKQFVGKRVIVTEKLDGENSSLYNDKYHARSIDTDNHLSRSWIRQFHASIKYDIPKGYRICGENLFAKHSIEYNNLLSYFYGFSIWNEQNICLSWDDTMEWFSLLGITPVPILYDGIYDENLIKLLWNETKHDTMEGYVIRVAESFSYNSFINNVAKFVRTNHVQTDNHWKHDVLIQNKLSSLVIRD
ncbi:MAG: RNA ligase family protein [Candidatus Riesia sp.]|nr:RNA ligase family protein [Candidatus Riesia sp.]